MVLEEESRVTFAGFPHAHRRRRSRTSFSDLLPRLAHDPTGSASRSTRFRRCIVPALPRYVTADDLIAEPACSRT
jgi:hypothetical protein